jgi:phosphatidylserine decarboxylase
MAGLTTWLVIRGVAKSLYLKGHLKTKLAMNLLLKPNGTWCLAVLSLFLSACNGSPEKKQPIKTFNGVAAKALQEKLEQDSALKGMLEKSIALAVALNSDTITNPAQTLDKFLEYTEKVETSVPWAIIHGDPKKPFDNIFKAFIAFYFDIDQPLPELEGKGLYRPTLQYYPPFAEWLTTFNKSWQHFLDTEGSWKEEYTKIVQSDTAFGLQHGWYEDPAQWKSFNQFFARHLSSPAARPVASPNDDAVVASYADAVPMGTWAVDSASDIVDANGVAIKSMTIRNIANLIGKESAYKDSFANGTFTHSFLNVNDYHRYHFPMGGTIREARIIPGINPTGGRSFWDSSQHRVVFDPSPVGWQTLETRGCVILETDKYGLVALLPIGMAAVGSVNFESSVKAGTKVKKGDMLGYFLFGGSDFIMVFQDKVKYTIDVPKEGEGYKHLLMGERIGHVMKAH